MAIVKAVKDQAVRRDDIYKSGEIRTGPGEPPNSPSKPTPRGRRVAGRPITSGKLLRPGGPGGQPSKLAHRPARATPAAQPRPMQQQQPVAPQPRQVPQAAVAPQRQSIQPQPVVHQKPQPAAVSATHSIPSHAHHASNGSASGRVPPPPPPPPPAATQAGDTYRAIYEFQGQTQTELALQKDEVVVITQKADNGESQSTDSCETSANMLQGWWLARRQHGTQQGWVPSAYLEVFASKPAPPAPPPIQARLAPPPPPVNGNHHAADGHSAAAKPKPPAPPMKRPVGRKPAPVPPPPKDSGTDLGNGNAGSSGPGMAGGLEAMLKQRQAAMSGHHDDDDDW